MSHNQVLNSQSAEESDGLGDNGLMLNDVYLPIELIQRIMCHADEKTLLCCQLVCKRWNEIILDYVWRKKAEIKTGYKFPSDTVLEWKDFYLICKKNLFGRNLLKNHSGENGFKHWRSKADDNFFSHHLDVVIFHNENENDGDDNSTNSDGDSNNDGEIHGDIDENIDGNIEIDHGANDGPDNENLNDNNDSENENENFNDNDDHYNGWIVECPPVGVPSLPLEPEFEEKEHCFVTTYYDCYKEQVINLVKEGFSAKILDEMQPAIEINEWYSGRFDCASFYDMRVCLLSHSNEKLDEFVFRTDLEGERQNVWFNVKHEFKNYGRGLRKISFLNGGRDRQFWAGHYGCKMAGAYVKAKVSGGL